MRYGESHILWTPRDFQLAAADSTFRCWDRGLTSVINVVPTGCGKTVIAAEMHARHEGSPSLFLVPRDELMDQSADKFRSMICGKPVETLARLGSIGREGKAYRLKQILRAGIVVAMVQSLLNVLPDIPRNHFGMIGTDECHHGPAQSYQRIFRHFAPGAFRQYGLTATPERSDGVGMFNVYQEVAYEMSIIEAVSQGWLVWPEQQNVAIREFDLRRVEAHAGGELHGGQLTKILSQPGLLENVVDRTMKIADGRKTAFYCHRKQISRQIHEILNRRGVKNYYIDESTPKGFRKNAIADFGSPNGCDVLSSVNALAEGFDCPLLEVIGFLCPTASIGTFKQKFGRLTRPFLPPQSLTADGRIQELLNQGKRALFLDFVGATGKHRLCSSADVLGQQLTDEDRRAIKRIADSAGGPLDMRAVIAMAQSELHRVRSSRVTHVDGSQYSDHDILKAYKPHPFDVLSLNRQMACCETPAATDAVMDRLLAAGLYREECGRLIPQELAFLDRVLRSRVDEGLCTYRQAVTLHKCGYDPRKISVHDAGEKITAIRSHNWSRPPEDGENVLLKKLKGLV